MDYFHALKTFQILSVTDIKTNLFTDLISFSCIYIANWQIGLK